MSGPEERTLFSLAYLTLLRLPHGACRARSQALLAGMRDEIARLEGRTAEDVQNEFEERVSSLQAEGGSP